jgi:hypothetical protein
MQRGDGTPWPAGQLATLALGGNAWKQYGVTWPQNIRPLGRPTLRSTILNQRITVPFGWRLDALFPQEQEINQVCFLSEPYPRQQQDGDPLWGRRVGVNYCGCFTLGWTRITDLQVNDWVAISFEGFAPNRQSADYIAQVNEGFLFRAP